VDPGRHPDRSPAEDVALVEADGTVVGAAPRRVVRRDNLRHAATAVLVRRADGRIYVHRRTDTKDWAPGHWDAAAGGMLQAGEDPAASAARELAEELGIGGVPLEPLGTHLYEDDATRCFEHAFEARWDGPVRHQPSEVAEGGWLTLAELAALLADPARPFVPDTRQLLARLAERGVRDYADLRPDDRSDPSGPSDRRELPPTD
jgi:8-oxo-dGTP pyrophosphatase MutT (NUDIX family)